MKEKIRELRKDKGYTIKQVAEILGVTFSCYAHYEQGIREPSLDTLKRLALLFKVSTDYLLGLTDF